MYLRLISRTATTDLLIHEIWILIERNLNSHNSVFVSLPLPIPPGILLVFVCDTWSTASLHELTSTCQGKKIK